MVENYLHALLTCPIGIVLSFIPASIEHTERKKIRVSSGTHARIRNPHMLISYRIIVFFYHSNFHCCQSVYNIVYNTVYNIIKYRLHLLNGLCMTKGCQSRRRTFTKGQITSRRSAMMSPCDVSLSRALAPEVCFL